MTTAQEACGVSLPSDGAGQGGTLVVGPAAEAAKEARRLRARGVRCAVLASSAVGRGQKGQQTARDYAARWGYSDLVFVAAKSGRSTKKTARTSVAASKAGRSGATRKRA